MLLRANLTYFYNIVSNRKKKLIIKGHYIYINVEVNMLIELKCYV